MNFISSTRIHTHVCKLYFIILSLYIIFYISKIGMHVTIDGILNLSAFFSLLEIHKFMVPVISFMTQLPYMIYCDIFSSVLFCIFFIF